MWILRLLTWLTVFFSCLPVHSFSHSLQLEKRRIGHRLPNILHAKAGRPESHEISKRRIGLRLPNIIYLRPDQEKKSLFW
ncbi:unnamed protein product, partial [Mesorhabditis belari]|uniref:Uncharacterized protein n=1 Tax=Mesorhabditis belari TaxID=2138241 RepID=A0AAF3FM15_9BILA